MTQDFKNDERAEGTSSQSFAPDTHSTNTSQLSPFFRSHLGITKCWLPDYSSCEIRRGMPSTDDEPRRLLQHLTSCGTAHESQRTSQQSLCKYNTCPSRHMLLLCHIPHLPVLPSTETQGDADGMLTYADAFRVAICFQAIFERITTLPLPLPFTRSNSPYHFIDVLDKLMLRVGENREQESARYGP